MWAPRRQSSTAVLPVGRQGPAQIDRSGGAVGDEIAVPEHEAQPVGTARRGGDVAVGKVVVYRAQDALLKQGIGPAKDEVDVPAISQLW